MTNKHMICIQGYVEERFFTVLIILSSGVIGVVKFSGFSTNPVSPRIESILGDTGVVH